MTEQKMGELLEEGRVLTAEERRVIGKVLNGLIEDMDQMLRMHRKFVRVDTAMSFGVVFAAVLMGVSIGLSLAKV